MKSPYLPGILIGLHGEGKRGFSLYYFTVCQFYDRFEMRCSEWKKYGKDRTYIDAVAIQNGDIAKVYKIGYIDNMTDTFHFAA